MGNRPLGPILFFILGLLLLFTNSLVFISRVVDARCIFLPWRAGHVDTKLFKLHQIPVESVVLFEILGLFVQLPMQLRREVGFVILEVFAVIYCDVYLLASIDVGLSDPVLTDTILNDLTCDVPEI